MKEKSPVAEWRGKVQEQNGLRFFIALRLQLQNAVECQKSHFRPMQKLF